MANPQDVSIGIAKETTYKTGVTPTRWFEFTGETLDWQKGVVQGQGLRVGSYLDRSSRRVVPSAQGSGGWTMEAISRGMGVLWEAALGANTSTIVSGSTYQQVATFGALPSYTIQKCTVEAGGTADPVTFLGSVMASWQLDFPNANLVTFQPTWDIGDIDTVTSYTTPSAYPPATASLFHHANLTISSGTLTAPTTTALASGSSTLANVRGGSISGNNNLIADRFNAGGAGRKAKPIASRREVTGSLSVEYDSTTMRAAMLAETPMHLTLTWTGEALSTGTATLQFVLPEIKLDGPLPQSGGPELVVTDYNFTALDNLTAAQGIWIVTRTADSAV